MNRKISITVFLLIGFTLAYSAVGKIDGKWSGQLPLGNGKTYPLNYTFNSNNGTLNGFNESDGEKTELTDGKIYGDSISFVLNAMGSRMLHTGKYFTLGDSISLNITLGGKVYHGTLKRNDNQ